MLDLLLNIISLGLKPLYEKNNSYYKTIANFRIKLSRPQNKAKKLTEEEKAKHPFVSESMMLFNVVDLATHKTSITEQDLDFFMNSIQYFNYDFMFFKKYYKRYSNNLLRLKPTSKDGDFDLVILQEVLKDDPSHPLKPMDVLAYHIKFHYPLTSGLYLFFKKIKKNVHNQ